MPNHVTNNIIFNDVKKFRELAISVNESGREYIDFNKLIPMPKDLENGGFTWDTCDRYGFGGEEFKTKLEFQNSILVPFLNTIYTDNITQQDFINKVREEIRDKCFLNIFKDLYGIKDIDEKSRVENYIGTINSAFIKLIGGFFNCTRYGYCDWYSWSIDNWGTKWNAYDCLIGSDWVTFSTAWSCPEQWLEKLAQHIDFNCSWADEDMGYNLGIGTANEGELELKYFDDVFDNYDDRLYLAVAIRGYNYEEELDMYEECNETSIKRLPETNQRILSQVIKGYVC